MINILNFVDKRFMIQSIHDISWYRKHSYFHFDAVSYVEKSSVTKLDDFLGICETYGLFPIYGVEFEIKTLTDTKINIVCYAKNSLGYEALRLLSEKEVTLFDLLSQRDCLLLGLDLSNDNTMFGTLSGLFEYLFVPDFVFIGNKSDFCGNAFYIDLRSMINREIIVLPRFTVSKENRRAFQKMFSAIHKRADDVFLTNYIKFIKNIEGLEDPQTNSY